MALRRCILSPMMGLLLAATAQAHPAVSLVMDGRGAVYYSDLSQVWVIGPDGTKRVAVRDVHTHELWLSPDGSLYGEDVTNVGERYRHRLWRLHPDGALSDVQPWRDGHPADYEDYAFARDSQGRSYVLRRAAAQIDVLDGGRRIRSLPLDGTRGAPGWLIANAFGVSHLTVGPDLWRWDPGAPRLTLVASDLVARTDAFAFVQDRHALMGLWSDAEGAVYVAVFAGQVVKRVAPDGIVSVAARSPGSWSPVGGLVAPDGALWLLEWSGSNDVRVRRLAPDGSTRVF